MNADERRRYRETADWRRVAARCIERAHGWCEVCPAVRPRPATEPHHVNPETYGHEEEDGNELCLVAVCHECHVNICHQRWGERLERERQRYA